ncbi:hypothetical protein [Lapidilactobacillus luobeiensis]|uniref:hypothetical protein n=1 Tax=Lapidilactobacillus luobeiensis TaxID=2950371 RepID=UPI0021C34C3E|nr:hypothetical protein [Lapidilactobacillus luobeiensis]
MVRQYKDEKIRFFGPVGKLEIDTPDGLQLASAGDYITRDANGGLHLKKPEVFETTFELA